MNLPWRSGQRGLGCFE